MAQRDKSQGFGFVYLDIAKLLREAGAGSPAPKMEPKPKHSVNLHVVPDAPVSPTASDNREHAVKQIKENLDRLQSLHHKLHAMLEELNKITDKKK